MDIRKGKHYIIRLCAAAAVCLLMGAAVLGQDTGTEEYPIVFLGDSLIGNVWDATGVTDVMQERLGIPVQNGAFGGTSASWVNDPLWASKMDADFSLYELTEAICHRDFGQQKAGLAYAERYMDINTQVLNYFPDTLERLAGTDFTKTEILFIEHGTNDYNKGRALDNPQDSYDGTTFGGALRGSIELLQQTYPKLRIILVTPAYCELGPEGVRKCYNTDYGGGYLQDYVDFELKLAEEYGLEVIDVYHASGIWEDTADTYLEDRLHLSVEGRQLVGNMIADYLLDTK